MNTSTDEIGQRALGKFGLARLAACVALPLAVAAVGGAVTVGAVETWYPTLAKPSWTPPSWLFAPVWTALYIMMGIALWLVLASSAPRPERKRAALLFVGQLALNLLWSLQFFGARSPAAALLVIGALVPAVTVTMRTFHRTSAMAGWLLAPYLAWTVFAAALNGTIWMLNR